MCPEVRLDTSEGSRINTTMDIRLLREIDRDTPVGATTYCLPTGDARCGRVFWPYGLGGRDP